MKKCIICDKLLYLSNFYKDPYRKDGLDVRCKKCRKKIDQKRRRDNPEKTKSNRKKWYQNKLKLWIDIVPKECNCEICGKKIYFNTGSHTNSIHFDHRHEGKESIKKSPINWISNHYPTLKNILIWKQSDFGKLCKTCNIGLPTIKRTKWIKNVNKYVSRKNGGVT